jgi:hypothetical protein
MGQIHCSGHAEAPPTSFAPHAIGNGRLWADSGQLVVRPRD